MKKVLIGLGVLIVLAGVGAGGAFMWMEKAVATAIGPADAPDVEFTVAKGTTARGLGPQLVQAGLIKDTNTWRFFLWRRGALSAKAGRHLVSTLGYRDIQTVLSLSAKN